MAFSDFVALIARFRKVRLVRSSVACLKEAALFSETLCPSG